MPPPESGLPIFQQVLGPPNAPTQAWALRTLGPEVQRPVQRLCAWIDEVAWGSETLRSDPRREIAARADGIARAHRGLRVGTMPRLLFEDGILAACAFAIASEVELLLEPMPPGPVTGVQPSTAGALRLSLSAPMGIALERPWDAFPLAFVSTPWEEAFAARPMSEYGRVQESIPRGRGAVVVLAPGEGGVGMTHLLVSVSRDRNARPREQYAATFPANVGDATRAAIAWADAAVLAGAHGGLLHPLTAFVWDNQRRAETWDLAGRSHVTVPRRTLDGGATVLDLSRAATRLESIEGTPFAPGVVTWFGAAWGTACGDRLARFSECVENVDLGGGCRRIVLDDPARGVTPELKRRQEALRREVDDSLGVPRPAQPVATAPQSNADLVRRTELARLAAEAARAKSGPTRHVPSAGGPARTNADAMLEAIRFAAKEATLDAESISANVGGFERRLKFTEIAEISARQLPPDPPFDKTPFLDLRAAGQPPIRLLSSSRVNWPALPGGAAPTSLENLRRLAQLVALRNPTVGIDPDTRGFLDGRVPARFPGVNQFSAWDARYDG